MDVSNLKDSYPNAPVFSVSWEILFETNLESNRLNESIKKLSESLQSDFPEQKPFTEVVLDQKIDLSDTKSFSKPERKILGSGFEIKNKNEVILIGTKKLVIITKNHSNFTNFKVLLNGIIDKFKSFFPINELKINRLGLRYINHCSLPQNDIKRFKEYFIINLNTFDKSAIANINMSFHEILADSFHFRTQYISTKIKNIPILVIDLDCFEIIPNEPYINFNELKTKSDYIAKLIKEKIALSITTDFENKVMEKEQ